MKHLAAARATWSAGVQEVMVTSPGARFWMEPGEELRLTRAARRGNGSAYAELVRWHHATLFRLAYALTRSEPSAVGLARDAVARGRTEIGRMPEGQRFLPWLLRITRDLAFARRRITAGEPSFAGTAPTAVAFGRMDSATAARFERALSELDLDDQLILALCLVERLAYAEIEEVLMLPKGAVLARVANGRARVEQGLGPTEAAA